MCGARTWPKGLVAVSRNLRARSKCARFPLPLPNWSSQDTMRPKKTILCVDDNEQALSVRKFMLETRGYRVLASLVPEQALESFHSGAIDLVICDLNMPRMDGNELARRMKELAPEVPILLVSGCVKAYDRATHGDCFLPKGACSPHEMLDKVRMMLARKRGPKKSSFIPERNSALADAREPSSSHGMPAFAS
jgi:two-component system response regulator CpxR